MPQTNVTEQIAQLLGVEFPLSLDPRTATLFGCSIKAFRPGRKKDEEQDGEE